MLVKGAPVVIFKKNCYYVINRSENNKHNGCFMYANINMNKPFASSNEYCVQRLLMPVLLLDGRYSWKNVQQMP